MKLDREKREILSAKIDALRQQYKQALKKGDDDRASDLIQKIIEIREHYGLFDSIGSEDL